MASLKLFYRASAAADRPGTLAFRVVHKRKSSLINTGIKVWSEEWDSENGEITGGRQKFLTGAVDCIRSRLENIINHHESLGREYSASDIVEKYHETGTTVGFISFGRKLILEYREQNNASAASHFATVINSFQTFTEGEEVAFDKFDRKLITRYEAYLKGEGLCPNTTSYYMRKLRCIYNIAVDRELTEDRNPFKNVYTGVAKTMKRALPLEALKNLRDLDLSKSPVDMLARDMFLFSYYTRGMSTVDMAYLKKSDLKYGMLTYRRQKTGQLISIKWEKAMQRIVDKHGEEDSQYLLPLVKMKGKEARRQYQSASHLINRHLKGIGKRLGLMQPMTMYVARHTWASLAHESGVPLSVISQGMGHTSEGTTRIYLASLDRSKLDSASKEMISLLE